MKKIYGVALMLTAFAVSASAQTNRTYKTDMSTDRIYNEQGQSLELDQQPIRLNKGSNNSETQQSVKVNQVQQFQGNRTDSGERRTFGNLQHDEISRDDLPYRSVPYDTSKNNGNCIGCGSGTMTDPHPWK